MFSDTQTHSAFSNTLRPCTQTPSDCVFKHPKTAFWNTLKLYSQTPSDPVFKRPQTVFSNTLRLYSQTPSDCVLPFLWARKFHSYIRQALLSYNLCNCQNSLELRFFTAVAFWIMKPCRLVGGNQCFLASSSGRKVTWRPPYRVFKNVSSFLHDGTLHFSQNSVPV